MHALTHPFGDALVLAQLDGLMMGVALAVVALYAHGLSARGGRAPRWRTAALLAGVLILMVTVSPPMERAAAARFSVHMSQHLLLVLAAAPLIVLGRPTPVVIRALPRWLRGPAAGLLGRARRVAKHLPLVLLAAGAWLLHAVTVWVWHVPALYNAALHNPWIHGIEHATMLLGALPFWMVVLHPFRTGGLPGVAAVPYLFTASLHGGALGALLAVGPTAWYEHGIYAPEGIDAVADQQMAGVIMWMPGALVYLGTALALFAYWMARTPPPEDITACASSVNRRRMATADRPPVQEGKA